MDIIFFSFSCIFQKQSYCLWRGTTHSPCPTIYSCFFPIKFQITILSISAKEEIIRYVKKMSWNLWSNGGFFAKPVVIA